MNSLNNLRARKLEKVKSIESEIEYLNDIESKMRELASKMTIAKSSNHTAHDKKLIRNAMTLIMSKKEISKFSHDMYDLLKVDAPVSTAIAPTFMCE